SSWIGRSRVSGTAKSESGSASRSSFESATRLLLVGYRGFELKLKERGILGHRDLADRNAFRGECTRLDLIGGAAQSLHHRLAAHRHRVRVHLATERERAFAHAPHQSKKSSSASSRASPRPLELRLASRIMCRVPAMETRTDSS